MSKLSDDIKPVRVDMAGVCKMLQCHKSTIFRRLKADKFPKPTLDGAKFYWNYQAIVDFANESVGVSV